MSLAAGWDAARRDAALAARAGFDSICTGDHLRHPGDEVFPALGGWSVLAAWAATTDRLRIGMMVSSIIYRHPAVLARQATAVDVISGGRLDLGVGAGVYRSDHFPPLAPWRSVSDFERLLERARRTGFDELRPVLPPGHGAGRLRAGVRRPRPGAEPRGTAGAPPRGGERRPTMSFPTSHRL